MKRRQQSQSISFFAFQDIITAVVGIFIFILLILFMELTQLTQAEPVIPAMVTSPLINEIQDLKHDNQLIEKLIDSKMPAYATASDTYQSDDQGNAASEMKSSSDQLRELHLKHDEVRQSLADAMEANTDLKKRWQALELLKIEIEQAMEAANGKHELPDPNDAPRLIYRDTTAGKYLCIAIIDRNHVVIKDAQTKTVKKIVSVADSISALQSLGSSSRHLVLMVKPSGAGKYEDLSLAAEEHFSSFGFDLISEGTDISMGYEWEGRD